MTNAPTTLEAAATLRSPQPSPSLTDDLRQSLGWHRLFLHTLDAVLAVVPTPQRSANVLLSLTTYCYAARVLSSADIESAAGDCWDVAYIIRGRSVTAGDVRRFRRVHRSQIEACLQRVFLDIVRARLAPHAFGVEQSQWEQKAREFAQSRVKMAIVMDAAMAD